MAKVWYRVCLANLAEKHWDRENKYNGIFGGGGVYGGLAVSLGPTKDYLLPPPFTACFAVRIRGSPQGLLQWIGLGCFQRDLDQLTEEQKVYP